MTAGFTRYTPVDAGARWWFVVGNSFLAMLPAESSGEVLDALWWHAVQEHATIESLVGAIPLVGDGAVRSFGVATLGTFAGEESTTVTAVVRGSVVIDLFSVGGARRFSADGVQPWVLADFRSVTGFAFDSEDALGVDSAGVTRGSLPVGVGVVEGSVAVWSARVNAIPAARPTVAFGMTAGGRAGLPSHGVVAPGTPLDDSDETIIRSRTGGVPVIAPSPEVVAHEDTRVARAAVEVRDAEAGFAKATDSGPIRNTVLPGSPQSGSPQGGSGAGYPQVGPSRFGTGQQPDLRAEPAVMQEPIVPRVRRSFRIRSTGDVYTLEVPAYIGRRPRAALAPRGPDPRLVSVHSPEQLVSSTHLHIQQVGDTVVVTDLGSTNGTRLLGMEGRRSRLRPGESRVVLPGSAIDIGDGNIIEITPDD